MLSVTSSRLARYLVDTICIRVAAGGEATRQLVYDCHYRLGETTSVTTCH